MACRTLLRRKTQLDLLEQACRQGRLARINPRGRKAVSGEATLAVLDRDGLVLVWEKDRIAEVEVPGQPLEVFFEHEDEHFVFRTVTSGGVICAPPGVDPRRCIKLNLPLRVERARRRNSIRLDLSDGPITEGVFTHVVDGRRQFTARIINLNEGGVGVTARAADVTKLYTGDLFWIEMCLPGEKKDDEFVVRLVHLRPIKHADRIAMGWAFQPTDDIANYERYVRRLEAFITKTESDWD